jgi:hypothetical protein
MAKKNQFKPPSDPSEALKRLKKQINYMSNAKGVDREAVLIAKREATILVDYLGGFVALVEKTSTPQYGSTGDHVPGGEPARVKETEPEQPVNE